MFFPITLFGKNDGGGSWDLSANVVAQYKMNDDADNTTVTNEIGTDGTLAGGSNTADISTTGKINNAFDFDGTHDYIDTNFDFESTFQDSFSVEFWVNLDDGQYGNDYFCGISASTSEMRIGVRTDGVITAYYEANLKTSEARTNTAVFPNGQTGWYHIVVTVSESNGIKIYANNSNKALNAGYDGDMSGVTMSGYSNTEDFLIGCVNSGGNPFYHIGGLIDNFRIFDKELSATEIAYLYNDGNGTELNFYDLLEINVGDTETFEDSTQTQNVSITRMTNDKAIVVYRDGTNSYYGTAVCLTLTGNSITVGTPMVFASTNVIYCSVKRMTDDKAIVAYRDVGNSSYGTAVCLSLSGTTISAGVPFVFESSTVTSPKLDRMTDDKAIVVYSDDGNSSYGTAICLSLSGTTISAGNAEVFESSSTSIFSIASMSSDKAIVAYVDTANSYYGTAICLSLSGTTVTAETETVFQSNAINVLDIIGMTNDKAIVAYRDNGNSGSGTAICLTLSGTTISAGSPVVFEDGAVVEIGVSKFLEDKAIVVYEDAGNSYYGTACLLKLVGDTITAGTPIVWTDNTDADYANVAAMTNSKAIVAYAVNIGKVTSLYI